MLWHVPAMGFISIVKSNDLYIYTTTGSSILQLNMWLFQSY